MAAARVWNSLTWNHGLRGSDVWLISSDLEWRTGILHFCKLCTFKFGIRYTCAPVPLTLSCSLIDWFPLLSSRHHLSYDDWRIRRKLSELFCAVLCTTVVHSDNKQFLKMSVGLGLGLVFVRLFRFSILRVFFWFILRLFCSCVVCFCCVRFIIKPRDWLN